MRSLELSRNYEGKEFMYSFRVIKKGGSVKNARHQVVGPSMRVIEGVSTDIIQGSLDRPRGG